MPVIFLTTQINAPIRRCFDLARNVNAHIESTSGTKERVVAGRISGLFEKGEIVTWEAIHFGIRQRLTVEITEMQPPGYFSDCMLEGAFRHMNHKHFFAEENGITVMRDEFEFEAPLGILGRFAEWLFLKRYMRKFLERRNASLKMLAESGEPKRNSYPNA